MSSGRWRHSFVQQVVDAMRDDLAETSRELAARLSIGRSPVTASQVYAALRQRMLHTGEVRIENARWVRVPAENRAAARPAGANDAAPGTTRRRQGRAASVAEVVPTVATPRLRWWPSEAYRPPALVVRAGAFDFAGRPSLMGGERVPYHGVGAACMGGVTQAGADVPARPARRGGS